LSISPKEYGRATLCRYKKYSKLIKKIQASKAVCMPKNLTPILKKQKVLISEKRINGNLIVVIEAPQK
jgi:hypothetical protein